jgi:hypothetical protein
LKGVVDHAGRAAALLAAVEVGLGSVLHAFRVPFAGHFLSLNQGFLLARAVLRGRAAGLAGAARTLPFHVSVVAAALKSLAPAGKKLTPMLAISAQGLLFGAGTMTLGPNPAGIVLGYVLLSLWAFVQPVLIYYVLFGHSLVRIGEYLYERTAEAASFEPARLLWVLGGLVGLKALLAVAGAWAACALGEERAARYETALVTAGRARRARARRVLDESGRGGWFSAARAAAGDLLNPLFLASLAATAAFFVFVESQGAARVATAVLRPLAVGFLLFFTVRAAPTDRLVARFPSLRVAIDTLRGL